MEVRAEVKDCRERSDRGWITKELVQAQRGTKEPRIGCR